MTGYALGETPLGQQLGREDTELEPGAARRRATLGPANSGRRVLLAIAVMIALLGGAAALSIWRYQVAHRRAAKPDKRAHEEMFQAQEASTHFWHQREAANEYFLGVATPKGGLRGGQGLHSRDGGARRRGPGGAALAAAGKTANAAFVATFKQHLGRRRTVRSPSATRSRHSARARTP